jgi:condensin complex subunit 3
LINLKRIFWKELANSSQTLAEENLTLFIHCFNKGHSALQVSAVHVLCDILSTHPSILAPTVTSNEVESHPMTKPLVKAFTKALKSSTSQEVQAAATMALCKLLLTRILVDTDLLRHLVTLFFDPASRDNAAARQALSYFLPAFAHSKKENMELLASVAPAVMHSVVGFQDEIEEDEEVVSASTVGGMLVEWTDARRLVSLDTMTDTNPSDGDIHLNLAISLLERIQASTCTKEERKAILSMLGKLFITSNSDLKKLNTLKEAVETVSDGKYAVDAVSRNALTKLLSTVEKAISSKDEKPTKGKGKAQDEEDEEPAIKEELDETRNTIEETQVTETKIDEDGDTMMEM